MSDYQRISCEAHSVYELAIMRGQSIQVSIDGNMQIIQPKDILTKAGAEYLFFLDGSKIGQTLRADKITIETPK